MIVTYLDPFRAAGFSLASFLSMIRAPQTPVCKFYIRLDFINTIFRVTEILGFSGTFILAKFQCFSEVFWTRALSSS
jgi:hypothetical protein